MKYPHNWKAIGVRLLYGRQVYYRDMFERRDVLAGEVTPRRREGARSPGGMRTDTVFEALTLDGERREFPSMTQAMEHLLRRAGALPAAGL